MSAHDQMGRSGEQRLTKTIFAERHVHHRRGFDEYGDDDVAAGADITY